jgi:hypothetical protein
VRIQACGLGDLARGRLSATMATPMTAIDQDLFCQDCGYNLRSLTGDRCPECGRSLEGLRDNVSRIPWVHRKKIGRFRAYWKTVVFVMFRQRQFCDELVRPVSYADSQKFRWVTVFFAFVPLVLMSLIYVATQARSPVNDSLFMYIWTNFWLALTFYLGFCLFLAGATGLPSYFFERSDDIHRRNRGIALSYYASGPLSLLIVPVAAATVVVFLGLDPWQGLLCLILAMILPLALLGVWWIDLSHLANRLMPERPGRTATLMLLVPILWSVLLALCVVVVPFVFFCIALVFGAVH